jgi:hypothetical protein
MKLHIVLPKSNMNSSYWIILKNDQYQIPYFYKKDNENVL